VIIDMYDSKIVKGGNQVTAQETQLIIEWQEGRARARARPRERGTHMVMVAPHARAMPPATRSPRHTR
jgi:hypothetical protein